MSLSNPAMIRWYFETRYLFTYQLEQAAKKYRKRSAASVPVECLIQSLEYCSIDC